MAMKVRRIVTGHNVSGKAIVKTDEQVTSVSRVAAGISGCEIWSTDQMPIDNSAAADAAQRAGFVKHSNYVGDGGGTTFRINEWAPGHAGFTHRTETMDYVMVACRNRSSRIHSVNLTWQTIDGFTQRQRFISAAVNPGSQRLRPAGAGR